jgi:hypothetical protein
MVPSLWRDYTTAVNDAIRRTDTQDALNEGIILVERQDAIIL